MAKTRLQKKQTITDLKQKLDRAKAVVFADYKGLTMKQLSDLRSKLYDLNAEFTITKNTLLKRALAAMGDSEEGSLAIFDGPTATLFAYGDEISPIKTLAKILKDAGLGKVKAGFLRLQGDALEARFEALDEYRVISLSQLPGKDELRGQTVSVLFAPLQGIVGVLNGNLRNLVYALNQIKLQKGGE